MIRILLCIFSSDVAENEEIKLIFTNMIVSNILVKSVILVLFLSNIGIVVAQPDTTNNRYATLIDASFWPTVNQGDYIFFSANSDGGNSIYSNGINNGVSLQLGKKILIWRGDYWRIKIEGSNCVSTSILPTIITNLGGQVKWGYSTAAADVRILELWNFNHIYLTGKYDPANQTGDINYLGHNDGDNYDDANFHENYGLWGNPRWSGYRYNNSFSNIVRIRSFETCKVSYVAASEGGFAGFNIKQDNPAVPSEVEIDIQDCFTAMTESEGFYISYSSSAVNQDITKLTLRNNIMAFNGSESMQTDNLVEGSLLEHNVAFAGACFHRRPFQDLYQDGLHQFSVCEGGVTVRNNAMLTGSSLHTIRYKNPGPGRVAPDATKKVLFRNNYYGFSRSNICYVWQGDGITPYEIDNNIYGPVSTPTSNDAYTSVSEWGHYFRVCNSNTEISINNTIYPQARPLYAGICGSDMVDTNSNVVEVAPILEFVNSGFPDSTNYRRFTFWSSEFQTTEKSGIFIPYKVGDYVFYDDNLGYTRFYCCIQAHAGNFDPNTSPSYWSLKTWDGNRLPPLDLRMRNGSYYDTRDIGLIYKDSGSDLGAPDLMNPAINFNIYPNPTNSAIHIQSNEGISEIVMLNMTGNEVLKKNNYISGDPINVLFLAPGIYVVRVNFNNHLIETKKFIIR